MCVSSMSNYSTWDISAHAPLPARTVRSLTRPDARGRVKQYKVATLLATSETKEMERKRRMPPNIFSISKNPAISQGFA